VWVSPAEAAASWVAEAEFRPAMDADEVDRRHRLWRRGVDRSRDWAGEPAGS
jgi:hypothetical protein